MRKNRFMLLSFCFVVVLCLSLTACDGGNIAEKFGEFETYALNSQKAFAEIVNATVNKYEQPSGDKKDVSVKKSRELNAPDTGNVSVDDLFDSNTLYNLVGGQYVTNNSSSWTYGFWKNRLPQEILDMQLDVLSCAKIAAKVKVDFLSEVMYFINMGYFAIAKADDGYIVEVVNDSKNYYERIIFSGTTAKDVTFEKLSFNFDGGYLREFSFSRLVADKYLSITLGNTWNNYGIFTEEAKDYISGNVRLSYLDGLSDYGYAFSRVDYDKVGPDGISQEEYDKLKAKYDVLCPVSLGLAQNILQEYELTVEDVNERMNEMSGKSVSMDDRYGAQNGDFGADIDNAVQEYRGKFYANFSFKPVEKEFFINEEGVLYEYAGIGDVVEIPDEVVKIDCSISGRKLIIPEGLLEIARDSHPENGFAPIYGFEEVEIKGDNPNFTVEGEFVLDKDGEPLFMLDNGLAESVDCSVVPLRYLSGMASAIEARLKFEGGDVKIDFLDNIKEISMSAFDYLQKYNSLGLNNLERLILTESDTDISMEFPRDLRYSVKEIVLPSRVDSLILDRDEMTGVAINLPASYKYLSLKDSKLQTLSVSSDAETVSLLCEQLSNLTLNDGLKRLSGECPQIKQLTIPDSVETYKFITNGFERVVFDGSREIIPAVGGPSLREVVFPKGVRALGASAFSNSVNLTSVDLPATVTEIGDQAFANCKKMTSAPWLGQITKLGVEAFVDCGALTEIVFSQSLTEISQRAFGGCVSVSSVTIPDSVTKIGYFAFERCQNLQSVTLGKNLKQIENNAFDYCNVKTVRNNSDLNITVGSYDFGEIAYNALIVYDKNGIGHGQAGAIMTETEDGFLFKTDNGANVLVGYTGTSEAVTLPRDFEGGSYSIYQMFGAKEITVPDGITEISAGAFENNKTVTKVIIGEGVTKLNSRAFANCSALAEVSLPDSLQSIDSQAFVYCASLTEITLPCNVETIAADAFEGTSVKVTVSPDNQYMTIRDGVIYDAELTTAKAVLDSAREVIVPATVQSIERVFNNSKITKVIFEEGSQLKEIPNAAFFNCVSLTEITLPQELTTIGWEAFYQCTALRSIALPQSVVSIANDAFVDSAIETVEVSSDGKFAMANGVMYNKAFTEVVLVLSGVKKVTVPATVTTISTAFQHSNITEIVFERGSQVKEIPMDAFMMCELLERVVLPDNLTKISANVFENCHAIKVLVLPVTLTDVTAASFGTAAIQGIYVIGTQEQWNSMPCIDNLNLVCEWMTPQPTLYFYSESKPNGGGNFWHYDSSGEVAVW